MKKTLFAFAAAALLSSQVQATDIIINSSGLNYSSDLTQIELTAPLVNMKQTQNKTQLQEISVDKFVTFWDTTKEAGTFTRVKPNAILSLWDGNNYIESTFIIHSAKKSANNDLILNVEYLSNPGQNITPVSINNKSAQLADLKKITDGTHETSVTVLVDCIPIFDGRC